MPGADPYDPHDNILAAATYLRELHDRYGMPGFFAAYNAGPTLYDDHLTTGRPLAAETRAYLADVVALIGASALDGRMPTSPAAYAWIESPLFPMPSKSGAQPFQAFFAALIDQPSHVTAAADWTDLAPNSDGLFVGVSHRAPQH